MGGERFLAEIKTTANLQHPHILPLFDSGVADGFLFYVMPHIEGESLRECIDREKQLGVDDAVAISQKVARERLTPRQGDQLSATEADHDACRDPNLVTVHKTHSFIAGKESAPVALHPRGQSVG